MRWALGVGGVLGLLCTVSTVPMALNFFARGGAIVVFWAGLPTWLQWSAVPPNGVEMLIVGALCALLLVSGRWPAAVCALVAAAWSLYAYVTFSPGGHWAQQIQTTFVMTPYRVAALVSLAVLLTISVLALVTAARAGGSAPMAGAARHAPGVRPHMSVDAEQVSLREITSATVHAVTDLSVAENQKGFVAPNAVSLAQALFAPAAWYRAIYCAEELVGFVMLKDESLGTPPPEKPSIGVWRFMIDAEFQGQGIGRAALLQVIAHARAKGVFEILEVSYVPGPGCPEPFYLGLGFRHTGKHNQGEVILEFPLAQNAA